MSVRSTLPTPKVVGPVTAGEVAVFADDTGLRIEAGAGGSWIPLVDGSEPPNFITDGAGALILVSYP